MAQAKVIDLSDFNDRAEIKIKGVTYECRQGQDGGLLVVACGPPVAFQPAADIRTPGTATAIAAARGAYKLGERLADGSIYIGLSEMSGKPLVTTAEDIGVYTHRDALKAVAQLDIHGSREWRLPHGHWNDMGNELNGNLFENRSKGALSGTFNLGKGVLTRILNFLGADTAAHYWAAEHGGVLAACHDFSRGVPYNNFRRGRATVRPVRELSAPGCEIKPANGNTMTAIAAAQKAYEIGDRLKEGKLTTVIFGFDEHKDPIRVLEGVFIGNAEFYNQDKAVAEANDKLGLKGQKSLTRLNDQECAQLAKAWDKFASPAQQGSAAPGFWGASSTLYPFNARVYRGGEDDWSNGHQSGWRPVPAALRGPVRS